MIAGTVLKDRYAVERLPLDRGGMGSIFRAHDQLLERPVVIKQIRTDIADIELVKRFHREARLTARMDHPGVPAVYDIGDHAGFPYLVMQPVQGLNLADLVAQHGPLPIGWVAAIGAQVSSVLLAANQLGLVHRDLKPSNVMLDPSGAVKVVDFGLAAAYGDDRYSRITQSGQVLGTLGYMAPEQIRAETCTHRTDLYGLGGVLFELITGAPPFDEENTARLCQMQLAEPPQPPSSTRAGLPPALEDLVLALLEKSPRDRPSDAGAVYEILADLATELPALPGVVDPDTDAVRAYSSIIGRVPNPRIGPATTAATAPDSDPAEAGARARQLLADRRPEAAASTLERHLDNGAALSPSTEIELRTLYAEALSVAGQHRPAARQWRKLAELAAGQNGPDSPLVFEFRLRAGRAHVALGERERALTSLQRLLADRIRVDGSAHAAVQDLRREIAALNGTPGAPSAGR